MEKIWGRIMQNKTKWILIIVTLFNIGLLSITVYAASGWLIKIDKETVLDIEDFEKEFNATIDTQAMGNPFVKASLIRKAKKDKNAKCIHLGKVRDELLVIKDARDKGILKERDIKEKVEVMSEVFRRNLISKLYIRDVIAPKAKNPPKEAIKNILKQLKEDDRYKKLSAAQKMKFAKEQAQLQLLRKKIAFTLNELRSSHRIKTSDYGDSLCE